jgi:MFS transporter, MHS family, proline/betaine transporter
MSEQIIKKSIGKIMLPALIGNIMEWYDFSLYGFFAPIIAKLFFPVHNQFLSLLATFSVFAIGYLMRPIGAAIFGHLGDRFGRKQSLIVAVVLMTLPTTIIGLLPTYQGIGIAAAIMLTLCRMLQGLACGGQYSGSVVYILEHANPNRRGMIGSFALFSAYGGMLLASGVGTLVSSLLNESLFTDWSWRIPFLLGSLLGIFGIYLRYHMPETPHFLRLKVNRLQKSISPFFECFRNAPVKMFTALGITFLPAMASYIIFVYLPTYLTLYTSLPLAKALLANTGSLFVILLAIPATGFLSDKIGRKPLLYSSAIAFGLFSYPLLLLILKGTVLSSFIIQTIFGIILVIGESVIPAALAEMFPTQIRFTGMGLPLNIANGIFGGTAPLIATLLIEKTHNILSPSFYMIVIATLSLFVIRKITETYQARLI